MSPPAPAWPEHPDDRATIDRNIARIDQQIAASPGQRVPFTLDLPQNWHREMHQGCVHVPTQEYIGNFRGSPGAFIQDYMVGFGDPARPFVGTAPATVAAQLAAWEPRMGTVMARFDESIAEPGDATSSRVNLLVQAVTPLYAEWIRIHPFADGNGRTARLLLNWLMVRYWQPLILPGRPPSDRSGLVAATAPALRGDYQALEGHLRRRLVAARKGAETPPPPP